MATETDYYRMSAAEMVAARAGGSCTTGTIAASCLTRIAGRESTVGAWQYHDPALVETQAQDFDGESRPGALNGVPIGIKDIIDTKDMPTEYGSPIYTGHHPTTDAACVDLLRDAGAVLMGKTVTTEFAYYSPGKTTNPHDPARTPGGSSSGSAAAVADFHVPLALGSQTAGSIIRPASYCGVVGFKPTHGCYALTGIHPLAPVFDTLGSFARATADIALLHGVLSGNGSQPLAPLRPTMLVVMRGPYWSQALPETAAALDRILELAAAQGLTSRDLALPAEFAAINDWQLNVMAAQSAATFATFTDTQLAELSPALTALIDRGRHQSTAALATAKAGIAACGQWFAQALQDNECVLTAAAPGAAPAGLGATGDPVFNRMWTAIGVPCICLPCLYTDGGLPVGAQLVQKATLDRVLLAMAAWLEQLIGFEPVVRQPG